MSFRDGDLCFFAPIAILLRETGMTGGIGYFTILLFLIGYYVTILSKGIQFIYDLKTTDAVRFSLTAVFFPAHFLLYFIFIFQVLYYI